MRIYFCMVRAAIVATLVAVATPVSAQAPTPRADQGVAARQAANPDANVQATALAEFQKRLQDYINLRAELGRKLKPLAPTADSAELAARQDTLAAAIREARKGAKPGDLIPTRVAGQIRNTVANDFRRRNPDATRAVFEEVPEGVRPVVNRTMPDNAALATVPPLLLNLLPPLPDNLQYRFMARHIVVIDGDTRIIVDYILNVLPPH
jgi:Skp family chaperone for outer membrane proteins